MHDGGGPEGWYFQPSLTPTWPPPGLPLPVTLQTGLAVSAELALLPPGAGSLTVSLALEYGVLSDGSLGFEGEGSETLLRSGFSYAF